MENDKIIEEEVEYLEDKVIQLENQIKVLKEKNKLIRLKYEEESRLLHERYNPYAGVSASSLFAYAPTDEPLQVLPDEVMYTTSGSLTVQNIEAAEYLAQARSNRLVPSEEWAERTVSIEGTPLTTERIETIINSNTNAFGRIAEDTIEALQEFNRVRAAMNNINIADGTITNNRSGSVSPSPGTWDIRVGDTATRWNPNPWTGEDTGTQQTPVGRVETAMNLLDDGVINVDQAREILGVVEGD